MPELPEVETTRRGLAPHLEGQLIASVQVRCGDFRLPLPADFADRLTGQRVCSLSRRGKYLLWHLENEAVLLQHLGMSGRMTVFQGRPPPPSPHDHIDFETEAGVWLRLRDPRRFGLFAFGEAATLGAHPLLKALGPEPLGDGFGGAILRARLKASRRPLKAALLDQRVLAGLGNIYVCESLYEAGLSPLRPAGSLGPKRAERLAGAIRDVLGRAIKAGGSSLRDHAQPSGELGYFQHSFAVYDREGAPCPTCDCRAGVRRVRQAGRSTFYCPKRQR